jgi:purine-nucleoside/S-methyl-5'-thioadenosine phosphorylase / adenosine deaminase
MPSIRARNSALFRMSTDGDDNRSYPPAWGRTMTLPPPDPAFVWTVEAWGHALRSKRLSTIAQHAFTTKELQLPAGGPKVHPTPWTQAAASVGAGLEQITLVKQVHAASVHVLKKEVAGLKDIAARPEADAIVSDVPGLVLSVQVADCVPILIADFHRGVVAAVHAGWRGTCAGVAVAAVQTMVSEFGSEAEHLTAAIGPSIGPCCYEIDKNVLDAFRDADWERLERWFPTQAGRLRLDLWSANRDQLQAAGLAEDHIYLAGLCTKTHRDVFESYRVDGEEAGRMLGMIRVP